MKSDRLFTALGGPRSIDGDLPVTNLIAKLVPEREAAAFSRSDYVIDLSSWFAGCGTVPSATGRPFDVVLEYDTADEFALTSRMDASFFTQAMTTRPGVDGSVSPPPTLPGV